MKLLIVAFLINAVSGFAPQGKASFGMLASSNRGEWPGKHDMVYFSVQHTLYIFFYFLLKVA
jgi:hypothetical protein